MMKKLSVAFMILATIGCTALSENNRDSFSQRDSRAQLFDRARALYQIREIQASLKTLQKITESSIRDETYLEAALFTADIYIEQAQAQRAITVLSQIEDRSGLSLKDQARISSVRERATKFLSPITEKPAPLPKKIPPVVSEEPKINTNKPVAQGRSVSGSIGVLLPLSGPFKVYGDRALAAIRLALGKSAVLSVSGSMVLKSPDGFSVVIMDSQGQADVSQQAVNRLVDDHNVGLILGDILADTALAIATRSKERDVINLSLSRKNGVTAVGPRIFRLGVTAKKQAAALLSLHNEKNRLKNFAVLYPQNSFGVEMSEEFAKEAKKQNVNISKMVGYDPEDTTFTEHIRRLVGDKKTRGNASYALCREKASRISDNAAKRKAESDCLDAVVPSVEFDALFIPEFPKTLGYIVPALISEGIMVSQNEEMLGAYRRTSRLYDYEPVQLLGPSSWNSPVVGEKLGTQVDGALFVDSADLQGEPEEAAQFVEAFKTEMGSAPGMTEALVFDAVQVLREIFTSSDSEQEKDLEQIGRSLQAIDYAGMSGKITFDQDRESVMPFRWFAFQEGKILPRT